MEIVKIAGAELVVMVEPYSIPDYLAQASNVTYWDVEDQKGQSLEFTRNTREHIKKLVTEFIKSLN